MEMMRLPEPQTEHEKKIPIECSECHIVEEFLYAFKSGWYALLKRKAWTFLCDECAKKKDKHENE